MEKTNWGVNTKAKPMQLLANLFQMLTVFLSSEVREGAGWVLYTVHLDAGLGPASLPAYLPVCWQQESYTGFAFQWAR